MSASYRGGCGWSEGEKRNTISKVYKVGHYEFRRLQNDGAIAKETGYAQGSSTGAQGSWNTV